MKKLLLILSLVFLSGFHAFAQDDNDADGNERIRDKMREFIQRRLNLSKGESERFAPVFLRYFNEWRTTLRQNKGDLLVRQQKVIDLRIRYRTEFREIVGEKRSNDIFRHQDLFIKELQTMRKERLENRPNKRFRN